MDYSLTGNNTSLTSRRDQLRETHALCSGLVWAIILFVLPLPLIQTLANGLPAIYNQEALAIQVGSIAYVWFLASIYLSTRPKWLDRLIGLPSIYFIHGMLSIFAIGLATCIKAARNPQA
ncbi:hypothetical protein [Secundilactobacillus similis]|uniref:hypothetical protein n=1 Tax=Secundilactobacillus similis TaxID=414682 RepID=UPI001CDAEC37|nr:hypothetical protein [Secundilactobacillus similis]